MSGWYPFWANDIQNEWAKVSPSAFTAVFSDDSASPAFRNSNPCNVSESQYTQGIANMISSTNEPVIFNGLAVTALQPDERSLYGLTNVIGGMREDCYGGSGSFGFPGDFPFTEAQHFYGASIDEWTQSENDEIYVGSINKFFFCLSNASGTAASSVGLRTYVYASFLLTYNPTTSGLFEYFAPSTGGQLQVYPETMLVPLNPVAAQPASIGALALGGVYVREYQNCYFGGTYEGACAAVVNPTTSTQSYPFAANKYKHTLSLSGGGVLEGGTASTTGPAPPSSLNSGTAIIVFQ